MAPGSLVRSSTAMARVVAGKAERKASAANGRYSRTFRRPTFSPLACKMSIVSSTALDILQAKGEKVGLLKDVDRLFHRARGRAHQHNDPLGVGSTRVFEEMVRTARALRELVHHLLNDRWACGIVRIGRLTRLKKDIRILRRAAQNGAVGGQGSVAMLADACFAHHRVQIRV